MLVFNDMLAQTLRVSPHAQERWRERSTGDIESAIKAALPYGGQYGSDMLLIHEETVFATKADRPYRVVTTVLTKAQANGSMQMVQPATRGNKIDLLEISPQIQGTYSDPRLEESGLKIIGKVELAPDNPLPDISGLTAVDFHRIKKITDEEAQLILSEIVAALHRSRVPHAKRALFQSVTFLLSQELRCRRIRRHADVSEKIIGSLKKAIRQMLGDEKAFELFRMADLIRKEEIGST